MGRKVFWVVFFGLVSFGCLAMESDSADENQCPEIFVECWQVQFNGSSYEQVEPTLADDSCYLACPPGSVEVIYQDDERKDENEIAEPMPSYCIYPDDYEGPSFAQCD